MEGTVDKKVFASKFRATRDHRLTPTASWSRRHGPPYIGYSFDICSIRPLSKFKTDDLMWALLEAAARTEATDLKVHFGTKSTINVSARVTGLLKALHFYGFNPMHASMNFDEFAVGWLSVPLFSKNDIPATSDRPMFHA